VMLIRPMIAIEVRFGRASITFCISNGAGQGSVLRALVWASRVRAAPNEGGSAGQRPHEIRVTCAGRDEKVERKNWERNIGVVIRTQEAGWGRIVSVGDVMCCLDCWTWRCSVDANATRWTGWERWERWERWELGAGSRRTARTMCACLGRFTRQGGLASLTLAAMVLLARHANCSTARHVGGGWCCYCPVRACYIGLGCRSRSSARLGWDRQSERTVGIPFVGRGRLLHRARASCTERLGRRWRRAESARTLAQTDKNKLNKLPSFCSRTETCSVLGAPVPFQFTTSIAAPLHLASLDRPRSTVDSPSRLPNCAQARV